MSVADFALPVLEFSFAVACATLFHAFVFALYALVPARRIAGYVRRADGSPSSTRLPGFLTAVVTLSVAALLVRARAVEPRALYDNVRIASTASCLFGVLVAAAYYVRGRRLRVAGLIDERARCGTVDEPVRRAGADDASEFRARSEAEHFYCGLSEYNPEWLNVDVKMWLYATGAIVLALNAASALAAAAAARGGTPGVATTTTFSLLAFFLTECESRARSASRCVRRRGSPR